MGAEQFLKIWPLSCLDWIGKITSLLGKQLPVLLAAMGRKQHSEKIFVLMLSLSFRAILPLLKWNDPQTFFS